MRRDRLAQISPIPHNFPVSSEVFVYGVESTVGDLGPASPVNVLFIEFIGSVLSSALGSFEGKVSIIRPRVMHKIRLVFS